MKIRIRTRKPLAVNAAIIAALLCSSLSTLSSKPPQPPSSDPWLLPVCAGVTVMVIGGVVYVKLTKFCKKHLGTNNTHTASIERSSNLSNWQVVFTTNDPPVEYEFTWADTTPMTNKQCFYRAAFP